jgi:hypothetical protein
MCPMCLAATGLYVAGGLSTGAVTTFLVTRVLGKRPDKGSTPRAKTTNREHERRHDDDEPHHRHT